MWIPKGLYESLPVIYAAAGASILVAAGYIGYGRPFMVAYFALGVASLAGGIYVGYIRRKARSRRSAGLDRATVLTQSPRADLNLLDSESRAEAA